MKPIIGITGNHMCVPDKTYNAFQVNYSPLAYTEAVTRAGGTPVIIPVAAAESAADYIRLVDALVLTGGQDVSPCLYDEEPDILIGATSPERDASEKALLEEALKQGKPILGICRGLQLINVVLGGTLYQDLATQANITVQHVQKSQPHSATHSIRIEADTHLAKCMADGVLVNSIHHQGIKALGQGLKVAAWSSDGVIEAIESSEGSQIVAVQWHPEELSRDSQENLSIFVDLVKRANQRN